MNKLLNAGDMDKIQKLKEGIRPLTKEEINDKACELLNNHRRGMIGDKTLISKLNSLFGVR